MFSLGEGNRSGGNAKPEIIIIPNSTPGQTKNQSQPSGGSSDPVSALPLQAVGITKTGRWLQFVCQHETYLREPLLSLLFVPDFLAPYE
ncbi:MAG: hypothetical protein ACK5U1_03635 [Cyclobacteriaceae bacterium]